VQSAELSQLGVRSVGCQVSGSSTSAGAACQWRADAGPQGALPTDLNLCYFIFSLTTEFIGPQILQNLPSDVIRTR